MGTMTIFLAPPPSTASEEVKWGLLEYQNIINLYQPPLSCQYIDQDQKFTKFYNASTKNLSFLTVSVEWGRNSCLDKILL